MKFKSITSLITSLSLALVLSACGSNANNEAKSVEVPAPKVAAEKLSFTQTGMHLKAKVKSSIAR